ncbi:putative reductase [Rhodococcus pyridinivorans AK37]|uniref:Putative reductase n=2 Tax=Nocardiaceae TaxID=85025 RepID=H0JUD5_9NOCA|nr:putative reductase [Rhodococcus pyridinivorans AK37]
MADLPAAVSIVTTTSATGELHGATISAVTSLSKTPPMLLVCLDANSETLAALEIGRGFLVHIVSESQQDVAMAFAGKGKEKFEKTEWSLSGSGCPRFDEATVVFECSVESMTPGGDHTIVVGNILAIDHAADRSPVVYHRQRMFATSSQ